MTEDEIEALRDRTVRTIQQCKAYPWKDWDASRVEELATELLEVLNDRR